MTDHRSRICFEVRTILSAYFQPHEDQAIKDAQLAWWADTLCDFELKSIVAALRKWNERNPRLRPTPGDVLKLLKEGWGKKMAATVSQQKEPEPQKERVSPERAAEILKENGFG